VVIELDVILEQYGPEASRGRVGLREALGRSRKRFFGDVKHAPQAHTFEETRATMHWMNTYFDSLERCPIKLNRPRHLDRTRRRGNSFCIRLV